MGNTDETARPLERIVVDTNVFASMLFNPRTRRHASWWLESRLVSFFQNKRSTKLLASASVFTEYESVLGNPAKCNPLAAALFFEWIDRLRRNGKLLEIRPERLFVAAVPTEEQKLRKKVRALLRDIDFRSAEERILARETVLHNLRFKDDKFLTCAAAGKADVLLTRDRDLSRLAEDAPQFVAWDGVRMTSAAFEELDFRVLSPEGFYAETEG